MILLQRYSLFFLGSIVIQEPRATAVEESRQRVCISTMELTHNSTSVERMEGVDKVLVSDFCFVFWWFSVHKLRASQTVHSSEGDQRVSNWRRSINVGLAKCCVAKSAALILLWKYYHGLLQNDLNWLVPGILLAINKKGGYALLEHSALIIINAASVLWGALFARLPSGSVFLVTWLGSQKVVWMVSQENHISNYRHPASGVGQ